MRYIRVRKHYLHTPFLILGLVEFWLLFWVPFIVVAMQSQSFDVPDFETLTVFPALSFAIVLSCCTLAMGTYISMAQEGFDSMVLRTITGFCLLGSLALLIINVVIPVTEMQETSRFWSIILACGLVISLRWLFGLVVDSSELQRNVLIYGAGKQAKQLISDLRKNTGAASVKIIGCVASGAESVEVPEAMLLSASSDWGKFLKKHNVSEVVIAPDERRRSLGGTFPLLELLDCKLAGVEVTDVTGFYEREMSKIEIDLLHPGWMLFSDGFRKSKLRNSVKRAFDLFVSLGLLFILWPFMLLTAIAVYLESGGPVLYRQIRVGRGGRHFPIYKFRSMSQDAEKGGKAIWATKNDSRVTRVGGFIRNTRLDELPQLYNVIAGHMSFVGPRPERPEFVSELEEKIPYYAIRHCVKPGLMGWAQLKYPYGASVEDAKNKLRYDLYYTKNNSALIDLLIMIQTVEVVLLGKGVH